MTKRTLKKIKPMLGILIALSTALSGCHTEETATEPFTGNQTFYLRVEGSLLVETQTRTASETEINDVSLLLFDGEGEGARYLESIKGYGLTPQSDGKVKVEVHLPPYATDCYLYVLANAEASIQMAERNWTKEVTTLNELKRSLLTPALPQVNGVITAMPIASPLLSALFKVAAGKSHEWGKDADIALVRTTAKITVHRAESLDPSFQILGLTLAHAPTSCFFFPEGIGTSAGTSIPTAHYGAKDSSNTPTFETPIVGATDALYLYESPTATYDAATSSYTGTHLIIQATYKAETGYYRMVIADADKSPYALLRNHHYAVTIHQVEGYGHHSAQEALNHPPANIHYEVKVSDGTSHDVVSNSDFYLGVTNSEYIYYGDLPATHLIVAELVHNAKPTTPEGISTVVPINASPTLILSENKNPFSKPNGGYTGHPTAPIPLTVDLPEGFVKGQINLRIGTVEKKMTIIRREGLDPAINGVNSDFAQPEYVYAECISTTEPSWAVFSPSASFRPISEGFFALEHHSGGIHIHYQSDNATLLPHRTHFYVSRCNNEGRIKVSLGVKSESLPVGNRKKN